MQNLETMTEKKIILKIVVDDENIANLYPNYSLNWDSAEEFIANRIADMCGAGLWDGKPIDYLKEYGFEITRAGDDIRDVAIRITDALVREGLIPDCIDTDNEDEFDVQDTIIEVLNQTHTL